MKLDRLLAITMTLLNKTRVNATELAERFEVSLRTIYRDMETINQAGIPLVSFAGSDGGYEIMPGYRIDKQMLSLDDFSAICSALRGARSATDSSNIDSLLDRISALMPTTSSEAEAASVDLDFTPTPNIKEKIAPLHQAIRGLQLVRFEYLDKMGAETERTIEPMGLFLKGYVWYLYGYCLTRSDIRVFRLSRMLGLRSLPQTFIRRNYTLQDVEQQFMSKVNFTKVRVVLQFNSAVKTRVRDEFGYDEVIANPDGTLTVTTHYTSMDKAIQMILSYSSHATVMEPPEVIDELQLHIRRMAEVYKISLK
ncbi:YafY family transcriptional regulator [Paenibacillus sp. HWE-109]|uniref:helix-turn-helix transcriptional regulator n=1 Tax=Paenibacillus sp. HWE-109 TaxID=1306526 RepID=UPI001EE117C6|nr:YafY family protein [Paenibacillus sp. HWE-109]UKS25440.1 YafY family transcriptional regulator [Paenibacillus sp. HWE-109]